MKKCPSNEELVELLGAALGPGRMAEVRAHVSGCDRCQDQLDRLTDSDTLEEWRSSARRETATPAPEPGEDGPALARLIEALRRAAPPAPALDPAAAAGGRDDGGVDTEPEPDSPAAGSVAVDWRTVLGPPERPGDLGTLGSYLVEAELGRGGMGIVLRAFDPALGRRVAIKVLRPDLANPRARKRLVREARAAAMFRHDHLIAVYAVVDPPEGLPYLVMEYLAGPTLARLIEPGAGMDFRRAAELVAQASDGLAAAHDAGLVHRDIKPDNIMIDPATGRAKVMDFGLARDESGGENVTREDVLAGTPTHMSPEQARGLPPDRRSDVYSLGVTLYECLTGEVPFRGAPHMVIRQVCEDEPRPPRRLNDRIPRDLDTICQKAMAREPSTRYATAHELRDDLRRWLGGEPIRARPPGPIGRLTRWCRRNTRLAATAATAFGLLALLAAVSTVAAIRITHEQRQTLKERQAARAHYGLALESLNSLVLDVNQKLGNRPGTLQLKRDILETARAGLEKIAKSSEAEGTVDRGAVVAYDQLGDVLYGLGRTPEAFRAFERARDLAGALAAAEPGSVQAQRDLARAHDRLGDLSRFNNDIDSAEAGFRRGIAIRQGLIAGHGEDPEALRDMGVSLNKIGLIHLRRGEYDQALKAFHQSLALVERYASRYPSHTKVLTDYEYTYRQLAQASILSDWKAAVDYSRKALESARAFVAAEPENLWLRKKLAIDLDLVGGALMLEGDLKGAEAHFLESQRVRQADLAAEPGDVENRRNVAESLRMLGGLARCRRDLVAASRLYDESLAICEAVVSGDPGSAQKQGDILENTLLLADIAERGERFDEATRLVEDIWRRLDRLERDGLLGKAAIDQSRTVTGPLRLLFGAARGMRWDKPSAEPPAPPRDLPAALHDPWRMLYALGLARRGHHAPAAAIALDVRGRHPDDVVTLRLVARVLGRCAEAISAGKPDAALSPDDRRVLRSYLDPAADAVRQTLRLAPDQARDVFAEPDLAILLRRGELEAIARELGRGTKAEAGG